MKNNKNLLIGVVVIIAVIIFIRTVFKQEAAPAIEGGATQENTSEMSSSTPAVAISTRPAAPAPVATKSLSYAQALEQYANKRIQLNNQCQASQNSSTYKNNTKVMIDNRASVDWVIKIGPKSMTLKAYGFNIITLSSSVLPATWSIDCGSSRNVANILIQK